ncbi:MAG: hypothetical protein J0L75_05245 [Spirochaetes bacterium]|nr:hypothetical protein [Spirochaetota bacterium]
MKYFNAALVARAKRLEPILLALFPLRWLLTPLAALLRLRRARADYLVADGFLIGDTVLIRPFLRACLSAGSKVVYLGGAHAPAVLADLPVIHRPFQWPWATYRRDLATLLGLLKCWAYLFVSQPRTVIEVRGDVRGLAFLFLACPRRLVGYSFTGGRRLLDAEPPGMGAYAHLEAHHEALARLLGLPYRREAVFVEIGRRPVPQRILGLSFSGSLPLKTMPLGLAKAVVRAAQGTGLPLLYLAGPRDGFLAAHSLIQDSGIPVWRGRFSEYVQRISTLGAYIGVDSGGAHLAGMYAVPALLCFGTQLAFYCAPIGYSGLQILEPPRSLPCRPCPGGHCVGLAFQECYASIPEESVVAAVQRLHHAVDGRTQG